MKLATLGLVILLTLPVFFGLTPGQIETTPKFATCYGYSPCKACSNCSACKHCSAGGTCGICIKPKKAETKKTPAPSSSGQCKATTQKGTQCSRRGTNGGYCWQHD